MMYQIEVDFEVYKTLTYRRQSEDEDYNDAIRKLLALPPASKGHTPETTTKKPWVSEGVVFPHGTEFQGKRKGEMRTARIEDGKLLVKGKPVDSLSEAVAAATGKGENGWRFWSCKRPGDLDFRPVDQLRQKGPLPKMN